MQMPDGSRGSVPAKGTYQARPIVSRLVRRSPIPERPPRQNLSKINSRITRLAAGTLFLAASALAAPGAMAPDGK